MPFALVTPHNAPLLRSRLVHHHWQRTSVPNVINSVRRQGFDDVDLLYIDTPVQNFWMGSVRSRMTVARIMDRASGFAGVADEFLVMERQLYHVERTWWSIRRDYWGLRSRRWVLARSIHLPNGVDFAHFAKGDRREPPEYDFSRPPGCLCR